MVCKKCGNELTDDVVFCTNCGYKIEVEDENIGNVNTSASPVGDNAANEKTDARDFAGISENKEDNPVTSAKQENTAVQTADSITPAVGDVLTDTPANAETEPLQPFQSEKLSGGKSFVRLFFSVILGIMLFATATLVILLNVTRTESIKDILANSNLRGLLEETNLSEEIMYVIESNFYLSVDVDADDITDFLTRRKVSEQVGEIVGRYVEAMITGDYGYHLTPNQVVDALKELSPEIEDEFNYKFTSSDYNIVLTNLKEYGNLEKYTIERAFTDTNINYTIIYLLFSDYPYLVFVTLCLLILFNIVILNRTRIRTAFITAGIPAVTVGILFISLYLLTEPLFNALKGGSLQMILGLVTGVKSVIIMPALIALICGVVFITIYGLIRKFKKSYSIKTAKKGKLWVLTGLVTNTVVLIICGIFVMLCMLGMPQL